ncbi:hypothetical protein FHP24_00225 [Aliirhizobium smilacinae]|uniref:Tetratricopeptide repeat protein n=1 Tax=Aliirhizobium smilacinae TaxID=1395944 RepID=A0A5C4XMM4_9HYPH|nr:hypothetical protein FHP24_00225 [Rhizobium smilacinae]
MSNGRQETELGDVSLSEAETELERLLADPRFHATDRAKRIFRYVAEKCFEGETVGVKAYAIALDVLNRPERFDTNSDPIVRIEVSRLRNALANYYEAYGSELALIVSLPVGRYLAVFTRSIAVSAQGKHSVTEVTGEPLQLETKPSTVPVHRTWQIWLPYGVAATALLLMGSAWVYVVRSPDLTDRPSVSLSMSSADDQHLTEADETRRYLSAALSQFRTLDLSASTFASARAAHPAYEIEMKYYADDDNRTVWWQVVDRRNSDILKSGLEQVQTNGRSDISVRDELVSALAKRFAASRGVISNLEAHGDASGRSLGNACVLRGEIALAEGGRKGIAAAQPCLERTLVRQPNNADAMAILSRTLVASTGGDLASTDFTYAATLANRAVSVDSGSDRAYVALMMVQFYAGKTELAIAAGNRALAINPNNPDVLAKLAGVLYSAGFEQAAVSLAEDASKNIDAMPCDAAIVLALDAYGRGDWQNASLLAEQINCSDLVVRAIRVAALAEMNSPEAGRSLADLTEATPAYLTSVRTSMEHHRYPPGVIAELEGGLAKAGRAGERVMSSRD